MSAPATSQAADLREMESMFSPFDYPFQPALGCACWRYLALKRRECKGVSKVHMRAFLSGGTLFALSMENPASAGLFN